MLKATLNTTAISQIKKEGLLHFGAAIFSLLAFVLFIPTLAAGSGGSVESVIKTFAKSLDEQNPATLDATLHPDFREIYFYGGKLNTGGKKDILAMIRSKKIGGKPRSLKIHDVVEAGAFAQARAILVSSELRFEHLFHLIKENGTWKINHTVLDVAPVAAVSK